MAGSVPPCRDTMRWPGPRTGASRSSTSRPGRRRSPRAKDLPMRVTLSALLAAMLAGCASTPPDKDPVQLRLTDLETRVERMAANQVQVSQSLDELQGSLRQLRGQVEELEHTNDALRKQQRDLFGDLERRLNGGSGGAPGA